jgi:hypothetical protein
MRSALEGGRALAQSRSPIASTGSSPGKRAARTAAVEA